MIQSMRNRQVLGILGKLRQKGIPQAQAVQDPENPQMQGIMSFNATSQQLGPNTVGSPAPTPNLDQAMQTHAASLRKKKLRNDEEDAQGDEEEQPGS